MNNLISKIINVALSIASIICFLSIDFIDMGRGKRMNGADILDMCSDGSGEFWPILFILIPIIQVLIRLTLSKRRQATICSAMMLIPLFVAMTQVDAEYHGIGVFVNLLITIAIIGTSAMMNENAANTFSFASKENVKAELMNEVHNNYDIERLSEIVNNPTMYNETLVQVCTTELDIRQNAEKMMPEVETYSDEKIEEILNNKETYSAVLIFCCKKVKTDRANKRAEEQRIEEERIAKEQSERRKAFWAKWRWTILGSAAAFVAIILFLHFTSNDYYFKSAIKKYNQHEYSTAIKKLSNIEDSTYINYLGAKSLLHDAYIQIEDSENATKAIADIYNAVYNVEEEKLALMYDITYSWGAYKLCADALLNGKCTSKGDGKDYETAMKLYSLTGFNSQCGACLLFMERYDEAFEILSEEDDFLSKVYTGLMYAKGLGCARSIRDAYFSFNDANLEDFLEDTPLEDGKWMEIIGYQWNTYDIKHYLVAKGDINLIYGDINEYSYSYGDGVDIARKCYAKAAMLFPDEESIVLRHKYVEQLYNLKGKKKNTCNSGKWYYTGEYQEDWGWFNGVRPYGYGLYFEKESGWNKMRKRLVIGNFGKRGNSFTWGKDGLLISRDKDECTYYIGYYDKNGEYIYWDDYATE